MIEPVADRVIIQAITRDKVTKGGIHIPDNAHEEVPQEGIVIAVGPGPSITDDGKKMTPIEVEVGDHILFTKYGRSEFKHDGIPYIVIRKHNCYAKIDCKKPHAVVANHICEMRGKLDKAHQPTIADRYTG